MTSKTIKTIKEDIYDVFTNDTEIPEEYLNEFLANIKELMLTRINEDRSGPDKIRLSQIGTPNRKMWYNARTDKTQTDVDGQTRLKFLYGDLVEELVLFLARVAGHTVADTQKTVEIEGVEGHQDCRIDGVVTDVKTASSYGFRKFADGSLTRGDDPFGYIPQISAYAQSQGDDSAAILAVNKENGDIAVVHVDMFEMINATERVKELKEVVASDEIPPRCYPDEPDGASGNRVLNRNCTWCAHKFKCWSHSNADKGLRVFKYAKGLRYFTHVASEPKVEEVVYESVKSD